jgi:hypothetical protein
MTSPVKLTEKEEEIVIAINVVLKRELLDLSSFTLSNKKKNRIISMPLDYYGKNEDMIKALNILKQLIKDDKTENVDILSISK